jgi:hypothetical protein
VALRLAFFYQISTWFEVPCQLRFDLRNKILTRLSLFVHVGRWTENFHLSCELKMLDFLLQICIDEKGMQTWTMYDAGPRTVRCPLICLPPVSGRADVFFRQVLALSACGYRVISVCMSLISN